MSATDWIENGPPDAARVFAFAHGSGAPMDSAFMMTIAEAIADHGIRVVRFEFPYMAARRVDGKRRPPNRTNDLIAAWSHVVETLGDPARLVIGGKSLGGRIASMIADEHRVVASSAESGRVRPAAHAGLGHRDRPGRNLGGHPHRPLLVDLEGLQVPLVDSDERTPGVAQGTLQFGLVVDLHQRVEADLRREFVESRQLGIIQCRHDEQHRVGAHHPGIQHVVLSHREVLAQHRHRHRRTSGGQVLR